jgi:hypothetical protein
MCQPLRNAVTHVRTLTSVGALASGGGQALSRPCQDTPGEPGFHAYSRSPAHHAERNVTTRSRLALNGLIGACRVSRRSCRRWGAVGAESGGAVPSVGLGVELSEVELVRSVAAGGATRTIASKSPCWPSLRKLLWMKVTLRGVGSGWLRPKSRPAAPTRQTDRLSRRRHRPPLARGTRHAYQRRLLADRITAALSGCRRSRNSPGLRDSHQMRRRCSTAEAGHVHGVQPRLTTSVTRARDLSAYESFISCMANRFLGFMPSLKCRPAVASAGRGKELAGTDIGVVVLAARAGLGQAVGGMARPSPASGCKPAAVRSWDDEPDELGDGRNN